MNPKMAASSGMRAMSCSTANPVHLIASIRICNRRWLRQWRPLSSWRLSNVREKRCRQRLHESDEPSRSVRSRWSARDG
jgi:hypothetical protein